jgi:imidazolonepropionase-like amidohydrolase
MRRWALGATLAALVPAGAAAERLAIVGATLIDGTGRAPLADAIVVVEGERIVAVGPRATIAVPKGATILDGRGRFVVPGLIDAHVHFFQSGGLYARPDVVDLRRHRPYDREIARLKESLSRTFARYLLSGITSVADVGGPFWNFEVRERAAATAMAPRVAVAGPLVSTIADPELDLGDPPIVKVSSPDEARALARRLLERKPDLVKVWFIVQGPKDIPSGRAIVRAAVEESRAKGVRVAVHATELETARVAVQEGAAVLVHSVFDKPVDDAFVALAKQKGVVYVPTLFVEEGYRLALSGEWTPTPAETRLGDPDAIATLAEWKTLPEFASRPKWQAGDSLRNGLLNLKRLSDAGVAIAAGTDAGNIGTLHGPSIFRELRLMKEAGLTGAEVLAAATRGGARAMGREGDLGVVAPGKLADLLLLDGDPTADLGAFESPRMIVKGGHVFTPQDLLGAISR